MRFLPALIEGLVAGVVSLVVLAVVAAAQARSGVTFAELLTALAVGIAVGSVAFVIPKVIEWQVRRPFARRGGQSFATHLVVDRGDLSADRVESSNPASHQRDRFDRFTDRARHVLTMAQDEAQRFNHNYIGTEHLLLGLVREGNGLGARVLASMGVELTKVRSAVEFIIGHGDRTVSREVGLTPPAKRVIELAIDEARRLGHNYIGTEHLLLGLVREGEGIAAGVLESLGVTLDPTRAAVLQAIERDNPED
jgi:hypothetical protein